MKMSSYSLITLLTFVIYISFLGSSYASTGSSPMWYRYTVEQYNGTSGEIYSHVVDISHGSSITTESYLVSGKAVPWSDTVPSNLSDNPAEYCAMSTAIREYFQNLDIIPQDIRFNQFVDVGHDYGNPENTKIETDFFVVLGSTKYNSTMINSGFYMVDSRYELNSQSLLDCNSTSPIPTDMQGGNTSRTSMVPEFPFAFPVLMIGIVSVIGFYRMRFEK